MCYKGTTISYGAFPLHIEEITQLLIRHLLIVFQEGDVIELCQVSDIRAGGLPKVSVIFCFISRYIYVDLKKLDLSECFISYFVYFLYHITYKCVENSIN